MRHNNCACVALMSDLPLSGTEVHVTCIFDMTAVPGGGEQSN